LQLEGRAPASSIEEASGNNRMKNNKRKDDNDNDNDDIEEVVPPANKKQARPVDTVDKKKKRKISEQPSSGKKAVKGVNDALRDFQNTFGISSPSNSASLSSNKGAVICHIAVHAPH
jgi:hypothetical protein